MQKIIICGNLTSDPVLADREYTDKTTGEIIKTKVCNFTVAVDDGYGARKNTMFFQVSAWRGLAEACAKYLSKGRGVCAVGPLSMDSYIDKNHAIRTVLKVRADDVQFLGARNVATPTGESMVPAVEQFDEPY